MISQNYKKLILCHSIIEIIKFYDIINFKNFNFMSSQNFKS